MGAALDPEALVVAEVEVQAVQLQVREPSDLTGDPLRREVLAAVVDHQPALGVAGPVPGSPARYALAVPDQLEKRAGAPESACRSTGGDPDAVARDPEPVALPRQASCAEREADVALPCRHTAVQVARQRPGDAVELLRRDDARLRRQPV